MAGDREELERLRELDRMSELEAKAAGGTQAPATEEEPGLKGGGFSPVGIGGQLLDAMGGDRGAAGRNALKAVSAGYISNPKEKEDAARYPMSSIGGKIAGTAVQAGALGDLGKGLMKPVSKYAESVASELPGADLAKGLASFFPRAYSAAKNAFQGGAGAAASGFIRKPEEGETRIGNAKAVAPWGVGGGMIAGLISPASLESGGEALKENAGKTALRAIGAQKSQFNKLLRQAGDKTGELGDFVLHESGLPLGASGEETLAAAKDLRQKAGEELGALYKQIEGSGGNTQFDRAKLGSEMIDSLLNKKEVANAVKNPLNSLDKTIKEFEGKGGPATLEELKDLKQSLDGAIDWTKGARNLSPEDQGYLQMRHVVGKAINDRTDELANQMGGKVGDLLRAANRRFGLSSEAEKLAFNKAAQEGNKFFSLTDSIAAVPGAVGGMAAGGPHVAVPAAVGTAMLNKLLRTYGPAASARLTDLAGKGLINASTVAPEISPAIGGIAADNLRR